MGKTIRWSMKDLAGCVQRGQMPLSQLPGILRDFENSAAETLRRTGADHVLYAVKIYNTEDELTAVQFYMNPMSDEEFSKVAGKGRGTMIYALHSRKVMGGLNDDVAAKRKVEDSVMGVAIEAEMQGFIYGFKVFEILLNRELATA